MAGHQRTADTPHPGRRRAGGHPGGRRTGGRYTADGHITHAYSTLWGKGGYGGSPNAEAGEMYQQYKYKEGGREAAGRVTAAWVLLRYLNWLYTLLCIWLWAYEAARGRQENQR